MKRRLRRCCSGAEDCAFRMGAATKNAIRVSLQQNRNGMERTFISMTLLFGRSQGRFVIDGDYRFGDSAGRHTIRRSVVLVYCTLAAEFWRRTLESTAVSDVAGKCEQKPMPT